MSNLNQSSKRTTHRIPYIDAIRGTAFLGMVVHHFIFFMYWHNLTLISPWSSPVQVLGWVVRVTFVLLVGVSSWLWFCKYWTGDAMHLVLTTSKRAAKVGLAAIIVTVFSVLFVPEIPVYFGVLHMITYSIVLVLPFLFIPRLAWVVGVLFVLLARLHATMSYDLGVYWLVAPSVRPAALDYFPVLPWFGVVLIGVSFGYYAQKYQSIFLQHTRVLNTSILNWLGRHALVLYVLHFPVIWGGTYVLRLLIL